MSGWFRRFFASRFGEAKLRGDGTDMDFVDYLHHLFGYIHVFALAGVLGAISGYALSRGQDRVYRAEAVVAVVNTGDPSGMLSNVSGAFGGLASLAGINLAGGGNDRDQVIAILRSRALLDEFVTKNNLLPILFSDQWDVERRGWRPMGAEQVPTLADAYKLLTERVLFIADNRRTGLITIAFEWPDREGVARWTTSLVDITNERMRRRAIAEAERSAAFLTKELERSNEVEVRNSIYRLLEAQFNKRMLANVRDEYALKVIDPPVVPDSDRFVKPRRGLMTVMGGFVADLIVGFVVTLGLALQMRAARLSRP